MGDRLLASYRSWRASALGSITDRVEERLLLDLARPLEGVRALDAGCGDGALARSLAARGASVVGVDLSSGMLAAAKRAGGVDLVQGDIARLPFASETFDRVVAVTVLCFVPDASGAVREMARVLRPGGRLVLGELARWSVWAALRRVKAWLGSETWRGASFHTPGELRALVGRAGLVVREARGAVYYPPIGALARVLAPVDRTRSRLGVAGAAFVGLVAEKPRRTLARS